MSGEISMATYWSTFSPQQWLRVPNRFSDYHLLWRKIGPISIPVGLSNWGMCGGIVSTALDIFHHQKLPAPRLCSPLTHEENPPLHNWIKQRQVESISLRDLWKYLSLMFCSEETRAAEIKQAWEEIRTDVQKSNPVVIGLELASVERWWKVHQLARIIHNHQVIVWKVTHDKDQVTLHLYDCRLPENENVTISFNPKDPTSIECFPATIGPVYAFFKTSYKPKPPPAEIYVDQS